MKFRKKPIEAIQYTGRNGSEIRAWSNGLIIESPVCEPSEKNPTGYYVQIKNSNGWTTAIVGDWIIFEASTGNFLSCKDQVFKAIYEAAE